MPDQSIKDKPKETKDHSQDIAAIGRVALSILRFFFKR